MKQYPPVMTLCLLLWTCAQLQARAQSISKPAAATSVVPFTQLTKVSEPGAEGLSADSTSAGNDALPLTLEAAEARALKNQPLLLSEQLRAQAASKEVVESRAPLFPQAYGNLTAVEANGDTAVAAGALTTSSISTRAAGGASLVQMVTDFGHTSNLVQSARFEAEAAGQNTESARQSILMDVDSAYFSAQAAESVRKTAQAVLDFRRVSLRQLSALAQSQLRSTLDVQFAQVLVSEAEMATVRADSSVQRAQAQLAEAMGDEGNTNYVLADEPTPQEPDADLAGYIRDAIANRPDLKAMHLRAEAATHDAQAERDLNFPTVNALASGGEVPIHDATIHRDYGAVGVNINVPIFNGGLFTARSAAAKLEAEAENKDASLHEVQIVRDVRVEWADARDAYLQIGVAQRLVDEANVAMRLAQARYDAGLGSIVELNQAELNQTSALITAASARFDYMRMMTAFQFALGNLH